MEAVLVNLVDRIENYWSKRSDDFFDLRIEELKSDKRQLWQDEIIANLPDKEHLKILDVGCGPGFFSVILSSLGHDVIGIEMCIRDRFSNRYRYYFCCCMFSKYDNK